VIAASIWHAIGDPWSEPILQRAALDIALLGVASGALGCWIVLFELSYSTESLSHALLPGLVIATLAGFPLLLGAALGLAAAVIAIALAQRVEGLGPDSAVAVAITSLVGLGALLALAPSSPPGLGTILFGDVLAVTNGDLLAGAALAVGVVAGLRLLHGQLLLAGFDRTSARALGGRPLATELALLALVAATIVVAVQALGNLLVVALLVGPASIARLLADRVVPMMCIATLAALAGGIGGLYVSYYAGTAAGASIASLIVAMYLVAVVVSAARSGGLSIGLSVGPSRARGSGAR
jgi:ABC-type Mn2+/Zn2+ transport system permease subunit